MVEKPKVTSSLAEKELDKAEAQFKEFDKSVKDLTLDRMNTAPKLETEQQTRLSSREIAKIPEHYLKPWKTIGCHDKFNEAYREQWEFAKQYVPFIAENNEIKGEEIDIWTKPFAGVPAQWWKVPVNKPVFAPRHVAERIKAATYHKLIMNTEDPRCQMPTGSDGVATYNTRPVVDVTVQRLDAYPVSDKKSIFMAVGT